MSRIAAISLILIMGAFMAAAQTSALSPAWTISLPAGIVATSGTNITNKCRNESKIKLESKDLKFLVIPEQPIDVPGEGTIAVSVVFDTRTLKPGIYSGTLSINCVSCGGESGCAVQREERKVILTVTAAMGRPQTTSDPAFDPKPVKDGTPMNRTPTPTIVALREFLKGPCPERERDCDTLRRKADELADQAKTLAEKADRLKQDAVTARRNADALSADDRSQKAVEMREKASSDEFAATSAVAAAAKSSDAAEGALSEYKKCLLRVKEECRKKD